MLTTILVLMVGATIEGRVVTAGRMDGVPSAKVTLWQSARPISEEYTDTEGRFRFRVMALGNHAVSVDLPGYERTTAEVTVASEQFSGFVLVELRKGQPERAASPMVMSLRDYAVPASVRKEFDRARKSMAKGAYGRAIEHFEKGLHVYPDDAAAHNDLGNCYRNLEKFDRAEESFKRAIELRSSVYSSMNLAELYLVQNRFSDAEAAIAEAIRRFPQSGDAYYGLANIYFAQLRFDDAEAAAREAHARMHRIPDVHILLSKIYLRRKDRPAVLRELEIFLKESPEGPVKENIRKALKAERAAARAATKSNSPKFGGVPSAYKTFFSAKVPTDSLIFLTFRR